MTKDQREVNLQQIAASSVALENETGIPAELTAGQCIIESGWLAKAPGNNAFGLKAPAGSSTFQILETEEYLSPRAISSVAASGRRIVDMGPLTNGQRRVLIQDKFMVFGSLDEAFRYYGNLLMKGKAFAARWQRFQAHRSVKRFLQDMAGGDGFPPYFTNPNYLSLFDQVTGQPNVKAALAAARAANNPTT